MFDPDKRVDFGTKNPEKSRDKGRLNWKIYKQSELLQFLEEIKQELPPLSLKEMNLEEELLLQLHTVRALQAEVMNEEGVAANQRAQVANTVAASLNKVVEMQLQVYSSERFKRIEGLLIKQLSDLPEEVAKKFLDDYEAVLRSNV